MSVSERADRTKPTPPEVQRFLDQIDLVLSPFQLTRNDEYWRIVTRSYLNPPDEISYQAVYGNPHVEFRVGVFDTPNRYLVTIEIAKRTDPNRGEEFSLNQFEMVTGLSPFSAQKTRGEEHLRLIGDYLKRIVHDAAMSEILRGQYWFSFRFDYRDWATTPSMEAEMQTAFKKSRALKTRG